MAFLHPTLQHPSQGLGTTFRRPLQGHPHRRGSLFDYPWSSVACGYALAPSKRPPWLNASDGLELFGLKDSVRDRRRFVERLDSQMAAEDAERCGLAEIEGQTLNSRLRRGWYWGSKSFKETMLRLLEQRGESDEGLPKSLPYRLHSDGQAEDLAEVTAERIIAEGVEHFQLEGTDAEHFAGLPRGDERRDAIAWKLWKASTQPQRWIAERLALRSAANVSDRVRKFDGKDVKTQAPAIRRWRKGV